MLLLPRTVGTITLHRKLGAGGIAETYLGRTENGAGRSVVVRRVLPYVCSDAARLAATEARVRDLMGIRHPFIVPVLDWVVDGSERFIVEERVEGVDLAELVAHRRLQGQPLPANVFLNVATQICNGLEALHGRPGSATGVQQVLHLGLRPGSVLLTAEGKVVLGGFGLVRSPTMLPHGGVTAPAPGQLRYLAPEQTLSDAEMSPASDIFSLGAILYELATNHVLFDTDSNLRTIHAVRRAEVEAQLEQVRDMVPGLDRVLTRALARNPRFRYHRAFVLREDLRGLMAGYSFGDIGADTQAVLQPIMRGGSEARPLSKAPQPQMSARQSSTLHGAKAVDGGLYEDTRRSGAPPPLFTEEEDLVHRRPELPASSRSSELPPPPAAPPLPAATLPSEAEDLPQRWPNVMPVRSGPPPRTVTASAPGEHTVSDPVEPTMPAVKIRRSPKLAPIDDQLPSDPDYTLEPDPVSEFGDVPLPYDSMIQDEGSSPEELPNARPIPARQQSWAVSRATPDDGTAAYRSGGPGPRPAESLPPPPLSAASMRPGAAGVDPNDTTFLPAPTPLVDVPAPRGLSQPPPAPPSAPPRAPVAAAPPLRSLPIPAPAAPASPEATGFRALPLPPPPEPPPSLPAAPPPAPAPPRPLASPPQLDPPPSVGLAPPSAVPPLSSSAPQPSPVREPSAGRLDAAPPPAVRTPAAAPLRVDEADSEPVPRSSGNTLLFAGLGMAALALIVCAGVGSTALTLGGGDGVAELTAGSVVADAVDEGAGIVAEDTGVAEAKASSGDGAGSAAALEGIDDAPEPAAAPRARRASDSQRSTGSRPQSARGSARRTASRAAPPPRLPPQPLPLPASTPTEEPDSDSDGPERPVDLDRAARTARRGDLDAETRRRLESTAIDDPTYTSAYTILAADAQARGDTSTAEGYLEQLMALAENRYNPVLLSELARLHVNRRRYASALRHANTAEQHWARIPSSVMFERKAEIYEVQAAATQGLLYEAEDDRDQLQLLDDALKRWNRYREHADAGARSDLVSRADTQIDKLRAIRSRLE